MATIHNHLDRPITVDTFFGQLRLAPGLNSDISDKLWKNAKMSHPDIAALLQKGLLEELTA